MAPPPLTNSVTGIAVALGMALGNDLRDGHPATAEQGKRVARLLERTELHREAGDRLRRARCHLSPVSRNGLALCYNGGMKNAHVVYET